MNELMNIVLNAGNNYFDSDFSVEDLKGKNRRPELVAIRHALFYLHKKHTKLTLSSIGMLLNRDHASVIYGVSRIADAMISEHFGNKRAKEIVCMCERLFIATYKSTKLQMLDEQSHNWLMKVKSAERAKSVIAIESSRAVLADIRKNFLEDKAIEGWRRDYLLRKLDVCDVNLKCL
jgi:hypothetical protein